MLCCVDAEGAKLDDEGAKLDDEAPPPQPDSIAAAVNAAAASTAVMEILMTDAPLHQNGATACAVGAR
jgi:hypothetical protein